MFELNSKSLSKIPLVVEENWVNGNKKLALSLLWLLSAIQCFYVTQKLSIKVQKEIFSFSPTFDICNIQNKEKLEKELDNNNVETAYLILTDINCTNVIQEEC